jgi:TRAP transporter TAXI family solute receptor
MISMLLFFSIGSSLAQTKSSHEKVKIDLIGGPTGATATVGILGISELVNEYHPWIQAKFAQGPGSLAMVQAFVADPSIRGKTISYTTNGTWDLAMNGKKPFRKPYTDIKALYRTLSGVMTLITLDPRIKTAEDLKGKRVSLGIPGGSPAISYTAILKAWGVWDDIKVEYPGWKQQADLLVDGVIDVAVGVNATTPTKIIAPPPLAQLLPVKKVYFINVPAHIVDKARKESNVPVYPDIIPANGHSKGVPEQDSTGYAAFNIHFTDSSMSDEVAYEFVKLVYEHCEELQKYHVQLKQINKRDMPRLPFPESQWHPGALRFYKERGIKPGM